MKKQHKMIMKKKINPRISKTKRINLWIWQTVIYKCAKAINLYQTSNKNLRTGKVQISLQC